MCHAERTFRFTCSKPTAYCWCSIAAILWGSHSFIPTGILKKYPHIAVYIRSTQSPKPTEPPISILYAQLPCIYCVVLWRENALLSCLTCWWSGYFNLPHIWREYNPRIMAECLGIWNCRCSLWWNSFWSNSGANNKTASDRWRGWVRQYLRDVLDTKHLNDMMARTLFSNIFHCYEDVEVKICRNAFKTGNVFDLDEVFGGRKCLENSYRSSYIFQN